MFNESLRGLFSLTTLSKHSLVLDAAMEQNIIGIFFVQLARSLI